MRLATEWRGDSDSEAGEGDTITPRRRPRRCMSLFFRSSLQIAPCVMTFKLSAKAMDTSRYPPMFLRHPNSSTLFPTWRITPPSAVYLSHEHTGSRRGALHQSRPGLGTDRASPVTSTGQGRHCLGQDKRSHGHPRQLKAPTSDRLH